MRPDNAQYDAARLLYNTRFDGSRPEAVARCATVDDVRECVSFASRHVLQLALRSGGHSYAGWSTGPGLVIDLRPLNSVRLAGDVAIVGAGARLIDVYAGVARAGRGVPAGSCPSVGVTGLTLGGGLGVLTRVWGLTCDSLSEADVVTADGEVRTCNSRQNADLFWALRGGGGGNFGVVTSLTLRTHPVGTVTLFFLRWPWARAVDVVRAWQEWIPTTPDALWSNCHLLSQPSGQPRLDVNGLFVGSASELEPHLRRLASAIGTQPTSRAVVSKDYLSAMLTMAGCGEKSVEQCHLASEAPGGTLNRETYAAKSHVIDQPMDGAALSALVDGVNRLHGMAAAGGGGVLLDALGGAVSTVRPEDTAFPHRGALATAQYIVSWAPNAAPPVEEQSISWLRSYRAEMVPHIGNGAYVNYIDPDLADWEHAYYGDNYRRLQKVKAKYDPDNLFTFPQAIRA